MFAEINIYTWYVYEERERGGDLKKMKLRIARCRQRFDGVKNCSSEADGSRYYDEEVQGKQTFGPLL